MADIKKLVAEFKKQTNLGFELFKEYKKKSEEFVSHMNKEINKIGLKLDKNTSLTQKKNELVKFLKELDESFRTFSTKKTDEYMNFTKNKKKYDLFSRLPNLPPNEEKKALYDLYINALDISKKIMQHEKEFIKYKRDKRKDKQKIHDKLLELQLELTQKKIPYKELKKLFKEINEKKEKIGDKTYTVKDIKEHLKSGSISNYANNKKNINEFKNLGKFIKREEEMIDRIKELREAIKIADMNKKLLKKQDDKKFKLIKKATDIKIRIVKLYETKHKGANIPPKIEDIIKNT
jgi:hypothetical protein